MVSSILDLPPELADIVFADLSQGDILSARLVCRLLYALTIHSFQKKCISTITTDLSSEMLERIKQLSECEGLKYYVKKIVIRGHARLEIPDEESKDSPWEDYATATQEQASETMASKILTNAICERFTNCLSCKVLVSSDMEWKVTGCNDFYHRDGSYSALDLIYSLIKATGRIFTDLHIDYCGPFSNTFSPPKREMQYFTNLKFTRAMHQLQSLTITTPAISTNSEWTVEFPRVSLLPNLHKLTLHTKAPNNEFPKLFLRKRWNPPIEQLELKNYDSPYRDMTKGIITLATTLTSLSLGNIDLRGSWKYVFKEWSIHLTNLESLELSSLMETRDGIGRYVAFDQLLRNSKSNPPTQPRVDFIIVREKRYVATIAYNGPHMSAALLKLSHGYSLATLQDW
jgi:hypothetical protein